MIDYIQSAELNNMSIEEAKIYFTKYPHSEKRLIVVCDICGKERNIQCANYRSLCLACGISAAKKGVPHTSEAQIVADKANGDRMRGVPKLPDHCAAISKARMRVHHSPERCVAISEGQRNSEAIKERNNKMRGGNDIVDHHCIYDHSDLSKNIVQMTRKDHTRLHHLLRKLGYIIPHINVKGVL